MTDSADLLSPKKSIGNYRWGIVTCLWLLYLINYLDRIAVLTLIPVIRVDLNLTHQEIGLAASIFFFVLWLCSVIGGLVN